VPKTLHIAWTVDDGPTNFTQPMIDVFEGPVRASHGRTTREIRDIPATWYIQRNRITETNIRTYQQLQNRDGHEIAIHGIHPGRDHLSWFNSSRRPSYENISDAISDLRSFHRFLTERDLRVKFIRLPYGLLTELVQRLGTLGTEGEAANSLARQIVRDRDTVPGTPAGRRVAGELNTLMLAVRDLGLHLWGGSANDRPMVQSWEAETAGAGTGRADNVPGLQIEMMRSVLERRTSQSGSFVILCHDTTQADVDEVRSDIGAMESAAIEHATTIRYHTMSSLFRHVTGGAP
jgi:peptidoglycan/xylan/chitin deacetylase (PgdA/CDA1 family)